jgi:hypothetical protein
MGTLELSYIVHRKGEHSVTKSERVCGIWQRPPHSVAKFCQVHRVRYYGFFCHIHSTRKQEQDAQSLWLEGS